MAYLKLFVWIRWNFREMTSLAAPWWMIRMKKQRDNIGLGLNNSMNVRNISLLRDARGGGACSGGCEMFFFSSSLLLPRFIAFIYFFSFSLIVVLMISWWGEGEGEGEGEGQSEVEEQKERGRLMELSSRSFFCSFAQGLFLWLRCYRCCCRATLSQRLLSRPPLPLAALPCPLFFLIPSPSPSLIHPSNPEFLPLPFCSTKLFPSFFHHHLHPPLKAPSTSSATINNSLPLILWLAFNPQLSTQTSKIYQDIMTTEVCTSNCF